jgi:hypothetical protein
MENKKLWFKAKTFGWGWQPVSWEGWVLTLLYIVALVQVALTTNAQAHSGSDFLISFSIPFIVNTIFFLTICYIKGEKPGWHWGEK